MTGVSKAAQSFQPAHKFDFEARCKSETSRESEIVANSSKNDISKYSLLNAEVYMERLIETATNDRIYRKFLRILDPKSCK